VPNVHYRVPRTVDPVRISHTVKKNMLKENAMYEKGGSIGDPAGIEAANDVALLSKDMEINFSNKNDYDDDDDGTKMMAANEMGEGAARLIKADSMDIIDDSDLKGVVQGMPIEDIKIGDKQKILALEEQKDPKKAGGALLK
jgi:hypothetical protein